MLKFKTSSTKLFVWMQWPKGDVVDCSLVVEEELRGWEEELRAGVGSKTWRNWSWGYG